MQQLPRLYPIVDAAVLASHNVALSDFAQTLRTAGIQVLQYRDKHGSPQDVLRAAAILREVFSGTNCRLILNDRADLAVLAHFDGVHVGQGDLSPADARRVVGASRIVGVSTHTEDQVRAADLTPADYIAIGPIFSTSTKPDAEPVVGLEGLRRARALATKPIVAIGGITQANAHNVIEGGADSVAVISSLISRATTSEDLIRQMLHALDPAAFAIV